MTKRNSFGTIRKLPSKRWQASYIDLSGKRINAPTTFVYKSDAQAWLSYQKLEKSRSTISPMVKAEPTYSIETHAFIERHIEIQTTRHGKLLEASTKALYRRLLRTHLSEFAGSKITGITKSQVDEWWAKQISTGRITTASKAYKLLAAAMKRAVDDDIISKSPCKVKGAQSASSGRKTNVPSPAEVAKMMWAITPRYRYLIPLAAYGGFRFGEITELRRRDFIEVFRSGHRGYDILVSRAVKFVDGEFFVGLTKSEAGNRRVEMSTELTSIIDAVLTNAGDSKDSLIFAASSGEHLRHDVFMTAWNRALDACGITERRFTPHSLRHFAGSQYAKAGANIPELKRWLGDSSTAAVQRYLHPTNRSEQLVEALEVDFEIIMHD